MVSKETFNISSNDKSYLLSHNNLTLEDQETSTPTHGPRFTDCPSTSAKALTPRNDFRPKSLLPEPFQRKIGPNRGPRSTTDLAMPLKKRSLLGFSTNKKWRERSQDHKSYNNTSNHHNKFGLSNLNEPSILRDVREEGEIPSFRDPVKTQIIDASMVENHNRKESDSRFDRFETFSHKQWMGEEGTENYHGYHTPLQNQAINFGNDAQKTPRKRGKFGGMASPRVGNIMTSDTVSFPVLSSPVSNRYGGVPLLQAAFYKATLSQIELIEERWKLIDTVNTGIQRVIQREIRNLESTKQNDLMLRVSKKIDEMESNEKRLKMRIKELKTGNKSLKSESEQKSAEIQKLLIRLDRSKISNSKVRNRSFERSQRLEIALSSMGEERSRLKEELRRERGKRNKEAQKGLDLRRKNQEVQKEILGEREKMLAMKKKYIVQIDLLRKGIINTVKEKRKEQAFLVPVKSLEKADIDFLRNSCWIWSVKLDGIFVFKIVILIIMMDDKILICNRYTQF